MWEPPGIAPVPPAWGGQTGQGSSCLAGPRRHERDKAGAHLHHLGSAASDLNLPLKPRRGRPVILRFLRLRSKPEGAGRARRYCCSSSNNSRVADVPDAAATESSVSSSDAGL